MEIDCPSAMATLVYFKQFCRDYYQRAAEACQENKLARFFQTCAGQEAEMLQDLQQHTQPEVPARTQILESLLSMKFFHSHFDPQQESDLGNDTNMLAQAIQLEKDSLMLLTELWASCGLATMDSLFGTLLQQEKKHLFSLLSLQTRSGSV